MRILLLTYHYPPDRAVGGHRAAKVALALAEAGHEVDVIAAGDAATVPTLGMQRVRPMPSIRALYSSLRRRAEATSTRRFDSGAGPGETTARRGSVPTWKRLIFSMIWLPDDRQGYILPALRATIEKKGAYDLVYSTAPPFSVHLAGLLVKVLTGSLWIVEFRDPWTANPWKPDFVRSSFSDRVERWLEGLCLDKADLVVSVSDGITSLTRERTALTQVITVRNGIEHLEMAPEPRPTGPLTIVYVGSFYHTRNPFPLLHALADMVQDGVVGPEDLRISFIGTADSFGGRSIQEYVATHGLEGIVRMEGWMDRDECLERVRSAGSLLLVAIGQPDQVPNKVYEYLGARRPILAIVDAGGETAQMLAQAGGHVIVEENAPDKIRRALQELLSRPRRGTVGSEDLLASWTTSRQMQGLVDAVGEINVG